MKERLIGLIKLDVMEKGFKDLRVYQLAYKLSMEIFELSKKFPKEEKYSLTDQIRRSSRSTCTNIAEGYRKRRYPKHFTSKMTDSDGEASETIVWLDYSRDCQYITEEEHAPLYAEYERVGNMPGTMIEHPERFIPKDKDKKKK